MSQLACEPQEAAAGRAPPPAAAAGTTLSCPALPPPPGTRLSTSTQPTKRMNHRAHTKPSWGLAILQGPPRSAACASSAANQWADKKQHWHSPSEACMELGEQVESE